VCRNCISVPHCTLASRTWAWNLLFCFGWRVHGIV
jgi:hypothetical protein